MDYLQQNDAGIPVIVKVLSFMMLMVLFFTAVTYLGPQVEGEAPKDVKMDLAALTMADYITMGETLFMGKGNCALCHNKLDRAPDLLVMDLQSSANERLNDPQYQGNAEDLESYLLESMINPDIYIVSGYGKRGQPSPMPAIDKSPIELSEIEMGAIIAFLQAKDGAQPSVNLPTENTKIDEVVNADKLTAMKTTGSVTSAEQALSKFSCTTCHAVLDSLSTVGPELNTIGSRSSKEAIRESIINPLATISDGYPAIMPSDYADKMTVTELQMIVDYLHSETSATQSLEANAPVDSGQEDGRNP